MSDWSANVITLRQVIASVPERWRKTYGKGVSGDDKLQILRRLESLNVATCTAEKVNEIIGNDSWTWLKCDGCGEQQNALIRIGEEPDYEARWQDLCLGCLNRAIEILKQESGE